MLLAEFAPDAHFGAGGARLVELIERYEFDATHPVAKQLGMRIDFFTVSLEPRALLLWWGDLRGTETSSNAIDAAREKIHGRRNRTWS